MISNLWFTAAQAAVLLAIGLYGRPDFDKEPVVGVALCFAGAMAATAHIWMAPKRRNDQ